MEMEFNPDDEDFFDEAMQIDFGKQSSYILEDVNVFSSRQSTINWSRLFDENLTSKKPELQLVEKEG